MNVDPITGNATWFINSTDFRLKYVVKDSNDNSASFSPTVTLCNCHNGAACNPSVANTLFTSINNLLIYGACTCPSGFTGAFCQNAVSYCLQEPCFEGVNCTDDYRTQTALCDSCPLGYVGDGRKCYGTNFSLHVLIFQYNLLQLLFATNCDLVLIETSLRKHNLTKDLSMIATTSNI